MGPWPHYQHQLESRSAAAIVDFMAVDTINPLTREKFPNGVFIVHRRGGGMVTCISPDNPDLLARVIRAHVGDAEGFWNTLVGYDIVAKYNEEREAILFRDRNPKAAQKVIHKNISLEDIGL